MCLGIPGEIVSVFDDRGLHFAKVQFGGAVREVCIDYTPEAGVGDFVLVHVGFSIAKIDRAQAESAWEVLQQLGGTAEVTEEAS